MSLPLVLLLAALTPSGESLYRSGTSAGGEVTATIAGGVRVAAAVVPCASCHGADGRGGSEGGVISPDIRWQTLTRPYEVTTASGRRRAPYTRRLLKRAIAMGIDSSGNTLAPMMPRFHMSGEQIEGLMSYLEALDNAKVPGVTDETVRVGVVLPPAEPLPGLAASFRSVVTAFFAGVSVYGRKIEPLFADGGGTAEERTAALRAFVREKDVLALVPAFTDGAEELFAQVADEERVPLLATMTARPASSRASFRWVRDLYAGTDEQARVLARYAARKLEAKEVQVVAPASSTAAAAALAELKTLGVTATQSAAWPDHASTVIFLGDASMLPARAREASTILTPASVAPPALLGDTPPETRVFIALPTTLQDLTPEGMAIWRKLAPSPSQYRGSQLAALASAALFVHALERAGRDVTRDSLLRAVDGVSRLQTGFSPALTFGPNRHIGSTGAWVVEATAQEPVAVWVE